MKRSIVFTLLVIGCSFAYSQINWIKNYDVARAQALGQNKFIVMDFWAIWCGPCKKMDIDMWNTEEMAAYADKFIFLKIDVDSNREIAMNYSANTIPKVVLMDASGEVIWEEIGFSSASIYRKIFEGFPSTPAPSEHISKLVQKSADGNTYFSLGAWYQEASKETENVSLKKGILGVSDGYFKRSQKEAETEALAQEAEFNLILNHAYRGAYKKAMKKVDKMEEAEMKNFIMAYCYKCEGQTEKMQEFMDKITSKELLAQLD
ncbi:thioredoxin family protein [Ekhidna sp.]|uniref:thioredoxin family protein n=1 Tax=Ekhidna sp. TaxID=2608089 RepID=UPI0032978276